jgi:hypothetical protein
MKVIHAEIIEKTDMGFVQGVSHVGITDHGLTVDSPNTVSRLSNLFCSSFYLGLDRAEWLVDRDDKSLRQSARRIHKLWVVGLEGKGVESIWRISTFSAGGDRQNGWRPTEVIEPKCCNCSGLDWRISVSLKSAKNIGPIRSERLPHLVEMALHDGELPIERDILQTANKQNGDREDGDPNVLWRLRHNTGPAHLSLAGQSFRQRTHSTGPAA